jgi:hypothetical protein
MWSLGSQPLANAISLLAEYFSRKRSIDALRGYSAVQL